jgi:hypothetical protein
VEAEDHVDMRRHDGSKFIPMHREIMGFPARNVDHRNGNQLDNQRSNLRLASLSQNGANRVVRTGTLLRVKGVTFHKGKYEVQVSKEGTDIYVGRFLSLDIAKLAYRAMAIIYHGEFAKW